MSLRLASFFSGIGGFELGFEQAGFRTMVQCEVNDFCVSILKRHWPDVPRLGDIREVTNADIPISDVWAGGFPCQDVSLARMGPRAGLKGKQSGLFYEFARLIGEGRPRVIVLENVAGLLSSHQGRDFEVIIRALADLGYSVGWRLLNSRYFGVPQSRQRIYIVGCHRDGTGPAKILFESERGSGHAETCGPDGKKAVSPFKESVGDPSIGPVTPALAYCVYACSARHTGTDWSRNYVSYPDGRVRRYLPVEAERLQGFPDNWTLPGAIAEADVDRIDSLRYHAIGNAVTVPVVQWVATRIKEYLSTSLPVDETIQAPACLGALEESLIQAR